MDLSQQDTRLTFAELQPADAPALYEIYRDADAMRFRSSKPMSSLADAEQLITQQVFEEQNQRTERLGIYLQESGILIGTAMFRYQQATPEHCEIGYSIGKTYWGQGYGTEVVAWQLATLKSRGNTSIYADCHEDNMASLRLLAKFGFVAASGEAAEQILRYWLATDGK